MICACVQYHQEERDPKMQPLLSICIPTFNRGAFLLQTLESISSQISAEVEVVVSDNASEDNTRQIVEQFRERIPQLTYFCWPENMGADRNFLNVVELAHGEFCWLMGSDDIVEPEAIETLLLNIRRYPQVAGFSVNRTAYTYDLSQTVVEAPLAGGRLTEDRLIVGIDDVFALLGDQLGFLSAIIIKRSLWIEAARTHDLTPYLKAYIHVYMVGLLLKAQPEWVYLHRRCVGWRGGNDSFLSEGRLKRLTLDVDGYERLARGLFGKRSHTYNRFLSQVCTKHIFTAICIAKREDMPAVFFRSALRLCVKTYWHLPIFWCKVFPIFLLPYRPFVVLRGLYKKLAAK
jgi:abequosyltransferase